MPTKILLTLLSTSVVLLASQIEMLEHSCHEGHASACYELGLLYDEGIGFEQNSTKAKRYYQTSCNYGLEEGCKKIDFSKTLKEQ